jgi:hypothetical protein
VLFRSITGHLQPFATASGEPGVGVSLMAVPL